MLLRIDTSHHCWKIAAGLTIVAVLAGCGTVPKQALHEPAGKPVAARPSAPQDVPFLPPAGSGRGGYYLDDGPGERIPEGLHDTPDAEPRIEPYSRATNRPYVVFGRQYTPVTDNRPYKKRGYGSWYGKKFHGKKTSSGELYDMYKMTAAHPTLPIPCYARVTSLSNGKQVIVRVNDRGPFRSERIIDLSYTAALKLGYLGKGSGQIEVEHLLPEEIERLAQRRHSDSSRDAAPIGQAEIAALNRNNPEEKNRMAQDHDSLGELIAMDKNRAVAETTGTFAALPGGYYLQLGAYKQAENAHSMRARYAIQWANKLPTIEVITNGTHHRLWAGPFASREKAMDAARQFLQAGGAKPLIVQR